MVQIPEYALLLRMSFPAVSILPVTCTEIHPAASVHSLCVTTREVTGRRFTLSKFKLCMCFLSYWQQGGFWVSFLSGRARRSSAAILRNLETCWPAAPPTIDPGTRQGLICGGFQRVKPILYLYPCRGRDSFGSCGLIYLLSQRVMTCTMLLPVCT